MNRQVTDEDVKFYLKEKKRLLIQEIERIDALLKTFDGSYSVLSFNQGENDVHSFKNGSSPELTRNDSRSLKVPENYSSNLTTRGKIAFALKFLGSGYREEVAQFIAKNESPEAADKIERQLSTVLSGLKKEGLVKTLKEGRKDRFFLT